MSVRTPVLVTLAALALAVAAAGQGAALRPGDRLVLVGGTFADLMREQDTFETLLRIREPGLGLSLRNLAWGGDRLDRRARPTRFPALSLTVSQQAAGVVLLCFGMGEAIEGGAAVEGIPRLGGALLDSLASTGPGGAARRFVIVSPIACEDLGERTPEHDRVRRDLERCVVLLRELSASRELPFVDLFTTTRGLSDGGLRLTRNGVHPNPLGSWVTGQLLAEALGVGGDGAHLTLHREQGNPRTTGLTLLDWQRTETGVSLEVELRHLPAPPPPLDVVLPPSLQRFLDPVLAIEGLAEGTYALRVGGEEIARASAERWQQGVWLHRLPCFEDLERLRRAIRRKNDAFLHRYRALNTVHTIGERRASPSGKALPEELRALDTEIERLEERLVTLSTAPAAERWVLAREESP